MGTSYVTAPKNLFRFSDLQPRVHFDVPADRNTLRQTSSLPKGIQRLLQAEQQLLAVGSVKLSISKQSKNKKRSERGRKKKPTKGIVLFM